MSILFVKRKIQWKAIRRKITNKIGLGLLSLLLWFQSLGQVHQNKGQVLHILVKLLTVDHWKLWLGAENFQV
jgi:hypothetical protein